MEQSIGDTVNVEFGEPRLADNVIRGHIRFEQGLNSYGDHFCHPNDLPLLRWGQRIEPRSLSRQSRIHAIRANHVSVGMEVQSRTEPLYEGDRPALSPWNTELGRSFSQGREDYAREDPHHRGKEIGVIRHPVTQTVGTDNTHSRIGT